MNTRTITVHNKNLWLLSLLLTLMACDDDPDNCAGINGRMPCVADVPLQDQPPKAPWVDYICDWTLTWALPTQRANIFGIHTDLFILRRQTKKNHRGLHLQPDHLGYPQSIIWNIHSQRPLVAESSRSRGCILNGW